MAAAGNFSKLAQMREQAFYAEATAQLARARHSAVAERERLTRLLGLWGDDLELQAAGAPARPAEGAARSRRTLEAQALAQRLDVQGATQRRGVARALARA